VRRHEVVTGLATLALAFAFAAGLPGGAEGARAPRPPRAPEVPAPAESVAVPVAPGAIAVDGDSLADFDLRLARASERFAAGDPWGVVRHLERLDFASLADRPEADRAAFLLAQAYRALGSRTDFSRVALQVARWEHETGYTRWLASQLALDRTEATGAVPEGVDDLFPTTAAHAHAFRMLAEVDSAGIREFSLPAGLDTASALGADLAGALIVREAARMLDRGADPRSLLAAVPERSRYHSRARHLAGAVALERGDLEVGTRTLRGVLADDSLYAERREVAMRLAARAMDLGRWAEAESLYAATDGDWQGQRASLEQRLAAGDFGDLWAHWSAPAGPSSSLPLSGVLSDDLGLHWSRAAAGARAAPPGNAPELAAPSARSTLRWPVPAPPAESWNRVTASAWNLDEARAGTARLERQSEAERARLAGKQRYFAWGGRQIADEDSLLRGRGARLDEIAAGLAAWDERLRAVRDEAMRRVEARARSLAEESARQRLAMRGMRHLHLEGPHRLRPSAVPPGHPGPDTLLAVEDALADWIERTAARIRVEGPERIARSYTEAWRPGIIDRVGVLGAGTRDARAWAARLHAGADSSHDAHASSDRLRQLDRLVAVHRQLRDSLERDHLALRERVAREAVTAARAAIEPEREAIAYGLAASSYAAAVGLVLAPADSSALAASAPVPDSAAAIGMRRTAIGRLQQFLADHPQSPARAEVRFRLADLMLVEERGEFRVRMAEYVRRQSEGLDPGPLPVLGEAAALDLYRSILRDDPDFPHRDAVRFNAGMILADAGDPEAEVFFTDLVRLEPGSSYAQEAWVRLGDMRFMERRFREASDLYARGAQGADPTLRAVATYKLGWAAFRDERFLDAATAFRDVLDFYASDARPGIKADVEKEAETYLVQALARAGGAETFALLFDGSRERPHEERVLASLAQQFRRYDRHADAIATDRVALDRYPLSAGALTSARRMSESFERWNDPQGSRDALLAAAPRFAPGSAWAEAQGSDSVRAAGAEFARRAWLTLAAHHHREARARDGIADWRSALEHYETVLARFPDDPESARYHLHAGEAAAKLERYPAALAHYGRASRSGADSLRAVADWQQVAVTDEWYGKRRSGRRDGFEPDVDSLARAVLATADRYVERHPGDPRGADLLWRKGQIALAHRWHERSATEFQALVERYPADRRTPQAAALRADAFFHLEHFADAGAAYEAAYGVAGRAGADSLVRRTGEAIPICYYRDAEAAVAKDSTDFRTHAVKFAKVAAGWPDYKYADVAQYRAGRAWLKAGAYDEAVRALADLARLFPASEFARDAHLEMARALEAQGRREHAARALAEFATRFDQDSSAAEAMLKAADLYEGANRDAEADSMRLAYVRRYPVDHETAMEIYEALARRDLKSVGPDRPLASLLPPLPEAPAAKAAGGKSGAKPKPAKGVKAATPTPEPAPRSHLAEYVRLAGLHPELASKSLLAEVRFRQGEAARAAGAAVAIRLPLDQSIQRRQKHLDQALAHYQASAAYGVAEWAHASACRIGQTLVEFGTALEQSERPADLQGDDLLAYEDVLLDRSQVFYDRGEGVWVDLLRQKGDEDSADPWLAESRKALWGRLGLRFAYQPETDYPRVAADAPARPKPAKAARVAKAGKQERRVAMKPRDRASSEESQR